MPEIVLEGCQPEPLASYLKALAVLRLVATQADGDARGWWRSDGFVLRSRLDRDDLVAFFRDEYRPTPLVAPWNGGSGFHPKDNKEGITAIAAASGPRFAAYRDAIAACRKALGDLGLTEKPVDDDKPRLIQTLRDTLDDEAILWIDAALVMTDRDRPDMAPLLGTGGNDGRLEFSNNHMQRLASVLIEGRGEERSLRAALFAEASPCLARAAAGQFHPSAAGGINRGPGFVGPSGVNLWEAILMLEGALLFAGAATRRLETAGPGAAVFPFVVRATGAGYVSASLGDEKEARDELWLPLWSRPTSYAEIGALLAEGRAKVAGRTVRTGTDFARAIAELGVDRGIEGFARYGFHQRNGLAYFATPLGRWQVRRNRRIDLLAPLDGWLQRFRNSKSESARLARAVRLLDDAILELARSGESAGEVLVALGEAEAALAVTPDHAGVSPIPPLARDWLGQVDDGTPEARLAIALASTGIRESLVPVRWAAPFAWLKNDDRRTVWGPAALTSNLIAVLDRRAIDNLQDLDPPFPPRRFAELPDVAAFIDGALDEERLEALLRGLSLLDWPRIPVQPEAAARGAAPPAIFALFALVHSRRPRRDVELPRTRGLVERGEAGDAWAATRLACRRLRGGGLRPRCSPFHAPSPLTRRATAALAFPLGARALERLCHQVLHEEEEVA